MPKKVAKGARSSTANAQARKEAEWRRRMVGGAAVANPTEADSEEAASVTPTPTNGSITATATRSAAPVINANTRFRGATGASSNPAAARGSAPLYGGPLGARRNMAQSVSLTLEDELSYIRGDIRRLVILAVIGLAVIIALAFILPAIGV